MINAIIEWSARNKLLVLLLTTFAVAGGIYSIREVPLDAIPDLSDPQVIVYTEWPGRSPDLVEDQVTYPIVSALLAAPHVEVVRGISDYGFSYVYVIFDEGTDIYWGRSRVLEYMDKIKGKLPEGVSPTLGPDATGVGWAFEYALVDRSGRHNLAELRSFNDWYVRYWLESVPGVSEVATVGGFVKQYQVNVDPNRLLFESLVVANCTRRPPRDDLPAFYGHEAGFIRIAFHLCHRAERAGVSIAPSAICAGHRYGLSHATDYQDALGDEPARCSGMTFRDIAAIPPPHALLSLWCDDEVAYHKRFSFQKGFDP